MTTEATPLLPCPFCGGKDIELGYTDLLGYAYFCNSCQARGGNGELGEIRELWNRRAPIQNRTKKGRPNTRWFAQDETLEDRWVDDEEPAQ